MKFARMGKNFIVVYSLLAVSLCSVVGFSFFNTNELLNDTIEYQYASNNLLNNNVLYAGHLNSPLDYRLYSKRTLGYPLFLLFQAQKQSVVLVASVFLYILSFVLGLFILRHFSDEKSTYYTYSALFLFHIALSIHATWQMADLLVTTCIAAIAAIYYLRNETVKAKALTISILWGICLLLKPVFLPSLIFIPIFFLLLRFKTNTWFFSLCLPVLVFLLGSIVNKANSGVFEYSSISTINFGQYNTKLMVANVGGVGAANDFTNAETFAIPRTKSEYVQYKERVQKASFSAMRENPLAYAKVHIAGIVKMILDPGRFEIYTFLGLNDHNLSLTELIYSGDWEKVRIVMAKNKDVLFLFLILVLVNFIKLFLVLFSLPRVKEYLFIAFLVAYFLAITGPVGAARFMLPVSILYLVLASIGFNQLLTFFQESPKSKNIVSKL